MSEGRFRWRSLLLLVLLALSVSLTFPTIVRAEQATPITSGTTYWVDPINGSDSNPGTQAAPLQHIATAASLPALAAGDCVMCVDGTYNEAVTAGIGGNANSPTGYVTFRAQHPGKAKITAPVGSYSVFSINASYIAVIGFDISGPPANAGGHAVQVDQYPRVTGWHHIQVIGNTLHDVGGAGFQGNYGDWYNVQGNLIYNTCSTNGYQPSGMSIWDPYPFPASAFTPTTIDTGSHYHNIISNNISHNNMYLATGGGHTDGEGIILDTFGNFPYSGRTLVASNLCYENGGSGVRVLNNYNAANGTVAVVDVVNNTCYDNMIDQQNNATERAEFDSAGTCISVNWYNNIAWSVATASGTPDYYNTCFNEYAVWNPVPTGFTADVWQHNIGYNPTAGSQNNSGMYSSPGGPDTGVFNLSQNLLSTNPELFNIPANWQPSNHSPAINYGLSANPPSTPPLIAITAQGGQALTSPPPCGAYNPVPLALPPPRPQPPASQPAPPAPPPPAKPPGSAPAKPPASPPVKHPPPVHHNTGS